MLALDYRGRGRSEYDPDWRNYDLRVELADVLAVLTAASVEEAVFVGTSRGGLLTMALSAARPALLRGAVLNDIGPVIEGARPRPHPRLCRQAAGARATYGEAVDILKKLMSAQFPALSEEEWRSWAEATWKEEDGAPRCGLRSRPWPAPQEHRSGGAAAAVLVPVRGSQARAGAGAARRRTPICSRPKPSPPWAGRIRKLKTMLVPSQGHAPLLQGRGLIQQIKRFLVRVESGDMKVVPAIRRRSPRRFAS